jgi:Sulfotransferase family
MAEPPAQPPTPEPFRTDPGERPKVLYVMGAGRSGSTILGVTLGNCEGVVFAGELDKWLPRSGVPQLEGSERARFWSQVGERVDGAQELFGFSAKRRLERSSALFRPRDWPARRRLRGPYGRVSQDLYRAVAGVAGAQRVVDSSHYPLRARELQRLTGIDLYLLFLVRDPQGLVASYGRGDVAERSFGTLTTNLYLWLTYLLSSVVFLRQPRARRLLVRHEDFLADPERVVRQILDLTGSSAPTPDIGSLDTGIAFQGNRLLAAETISLRRTSEPPARVSRVTALLQLPWAATLPRLRPATGQAAGADTERA